MEWEVIESMHRKNAELQANHTRMVAEHNHQQAQINAVLSVFFAEQMVNAMAMLNGMYQPDEGE